VFTPDDHRAEAPPVMVINEGLAAALFGEQDPLGRQVQSVGRTWEVIGVVATARHRDLTEPVWKRVYCPQRYDPWTCGVVVRTRGAPETLIGLLRETLRAVDPEQAIANLRVLRHDVDRSLGPRRVTLGLVAVFAAAALALACLGIFGVMAYTIEQRRRELCIRLALGAQPGDILRMVLGDGFRLGATGIVLGLAGGLAGARLIAAQLYAVTPFDATVLLVAVGVALIVVGISILAPAWRATRNDATAALRAE
jgi:putative ABC transport system permease protein